MMLEDFPLYIAIYFAAVSLLAIVLTIYDKWAAKSGLRRVKENNLLLVAVFGGAIALFITMKVVRHKTKHTKFMIGIPVIIMLQIAAVLLAWWTLKNGGAIA